MKILSPTTYFYPEQAASSYLWLNLCERIAEEGIEQVKFTPIPTRGISEETRNKYKKKRIESWYDGKLTIKRFPLMNEGKNHIQRAFRYLLECVAQVWLGCFDKLANDTDVVMVTSTPPVMGLCGALIKRKRRIPMIYILQDIFPDSLVGTGLAKKNGILWKIGRWIENTTYRNADKIIVISEDFRKNILAKGVPDGKISVIYNWVDQNAVVDIPRSQNKLIVKYGLNPDKFYISYNGNIGLTQNMDMLLDVAKELEEYRDIQFVLVGEGTYKKQVENIIKRDSINNVTMLPFQPYTDISHVFSLGDVSLVISKPGVGANSVPSKTWSIMSASRPVLANFDENEMKTILTENECGIFTKAGDKRSFKEAILKLYNNRDLCEEYGRNGRIFIMRNLTKEVGTKKYINVINEVTNKYKTS